MYVDDNIYNIDVTLNVQKLVDVLGIYFVQYVGSSCCLCLVPLFVTVTINMSNFMAPLTFLQSFWTPFALLITNFFYPSTMTSAYSCFSDDQPVTSNCENSSLYVLEWLLPRIGFLDKIIVKDLAGLACKIFLKTIALGGHSTEVVRLQSNTDFSKFHG
ncbi:DNA repair protein like [Arachis hypogaea]|nr:DNA repair protein like [Arachis hypogaea]